MELAIVMSPDLGNPDLGDMLLVNGTAVLISDLSSEVAQRLHVAFRFWRGEWFLDTRQGAPYVEVLFEQGVDDRVIRAFFTSLILSVEGVASLPVLTYTLDGETGRLEARFEVLLANGQIFRSDDFGPFILSVAP